ncbi:hypothetical protein [Sansalvadorimonas verongulae]|uniref:hypothetical protein n=1 Tax=Sansalvadorimonas verongulae TaxID=2172824 RepID=UPI0012BBE53E|nr:hypothetical protein [Sansalvadorimonas verongulae]MTI13740.1 hypothetical protein [Sansalvadorimonas verongulae]
MKNLLKLSFLTKIAIFSSLYIAQIALFWSAFSKFSAPPQWLTDSLAGSPLSSLTGLGWVTIGVLELLALVLVILSILKREFAGSNNATFLKAAISFGMVALAVMAMGTSFASDFESKASLIYYVGAQAIMYMVACKEAQE